jgi:hypothetical protein
MSVYWSSLLTHDQVIKKLKKKKEEKEKNSSRMIQ